MISSATIPRRDLWRNATPSPWRGDKQLLDSNNDWKFYERIWTVFVDKLRKLHSLTNRIEESCCVSGHDDYKDQEQEDENGDVFTSEYDHSLEP